MPGDGIALHFLRALDSLVERVHPATNRIFSQRARKLDPCIFAVKMEVPVPRITGQSPLQDALDGLECSLADQADEVRMSVPDPDEAEERRLPLSPSSKFR